MTPEEHEHVQRLEGKVKRYRNRIALLKEALITAKRVIRDWQHIENGGEAAEDVWRLYQSSPEMIQINAAIARNTETE
jgi:hypothetical protein